MTVQSCLCCVHVSSCVFVCVLIMFEFMNSTGSNLFQALWLFLHMPFAPTSQPQWRRISRIQMEKVTERKDESITLIGWKQDFDLNWPEATLSTPSQCYLFIYLFFYTSRRVVVGPSQSRPPPSRRLCPSSVLQPAGGRLSWPGPAWVPERLLHHHPEAHRGSVCQHIQTFKYPDEHMQVFALVKSA